MGSPAIELAYVYSIEYSKLLSQPQCIGDSVHVSLINRLSLQEYIIGHMGYCKRNHKNTCLKCTHVKICCSCSS